MNPQLHIHISFWRVKPNKKLYAIKEFDIYLQKTQKIVVYVGAFRL